MLLSADIPYREGALITLVHEQGTLLHEEYLEDGVRIVAKLPARIAPRLKALSHRVDEAPKNAQNNGLMQQIKGVHDVQGWRAPGRDWRKAQLGADVHIF